jgi:hypothetical protein
MKANNVMVVWFPFRFPPIETFLKRKALTCDYFCETMGPHVLGWSHQTRGVRQLKKFKSGAEILALTNVQMENASLDYLLGTLRFLRSQARF